MKIKQEIAELKRYRNAYILALSAAMGSMFFGWDMGLIGGVIAMDSFKHAFGVDQLSASAQANLNGNIVAMLQAGCFFGALFSGPMSTQWGRKWPLVTSGVIYLIGSVIQTISGIGSSASVGLSVLYFGRFVGGFGLGLMSAIVPSYVAECTPKAIRGRCTGFIQFSNNIGMMLSFWVNYSASANLPYGNMQWRMPFAVQLITGFLFAILMLPQPESPRWLVEHERYDQAAQTLAYVARKPADDPIVIATLNEIKADFATSKRIPLLAQFRMMGSSRSMLIRAYIPSFVLCWQQWTGTNAINYFSPQIFQGLGISGTTSSLFATGVYGVIKVIAVGLTTLLGIEGMGRKLCLIIGGLGQGLTMFWIGGYSAIHPQDTIVPASYVSIVAVYLYAVFYCIGWGPVPWVVASEVVDNKVRTAALSIAVAINWLFVFVVSRATPVMLDQITYGTFILFGACCIVMSIWTYVCLPETTGYALEDIKYLFEKDVILRSVQDSPGGRMFLGAKRASPMAEIKAESEQGELPGADEDGKKGDSSSRIEQIGADVDVL